MFDYMLYIDAYSPETIPMGRLAEYMTAFADLLGHKGEVDLSRFRAAPGTRLGHIPFESDRAFPAQC